MEDYWRPIQLQEYADRYLVSRDGEIWGIKSGKKRKHHLRNGYPAVSLYNGTSKTFHIHYLVAITFLLRNDPTLIVNHKDGKTINNKVKNLEWVTYKQNTQHALETGLKIPHTKKVSQYTRDGVKIATFNSVKEASEKTGCSSKHIPSVCRGKRQSTGGFIWKYENVEDAPEIFDGIGLQHPDFPGYYVKSDGRVYSTITNRYLRPKINRSGYHVVGLNNNGVRREFYVHRLVAELYLPFDPIRNVVNHKNMNTANNKVENLEWCTHSENKLHAMKNLDLKGVAQYTLDNVFMLSFTSIQLASICTDVGSNDIIECCKGKVEHSGGYKWKYTNR